MIPSETYVISQGSMLSEDNDNYWRVVSNIDVDRLIQDHAFEEWEPTSGDKAFHFGYYYYNPTTVLGDGFNSKSSNRPDLGLAYTIETCGAGQAPTGNPNADPYELCQTCPAHQYSSTNDKECKQCNFGEVPTSTRDGCVKCPAHQYAGDQDAICHSCDVGKVPNSQQSGC